MGEKGHRGWSLKQIGRSEDSGLGFLADYRGVEVLDTGHFNDGIC